MEGEKDFDGDPVETLVSRLIRRGDSIKVNLKN